MVDIQTVSIAVASASVVAGVIYYSLQIRHQNLQIQQQTKMRQTDLVMKLYSQFSSVEFQKVWEKVMRSGAKDFDDYTEKYGWSEALSVAMFFEGIAILLKRKLIDIDLVGDMFAISIRMTWEKVKDLALEARKVRNEPELFSWIEYLYNEIEKRRQKIQAKKG